MAGGLGSFMEKAGGLGWFTSKKPHGVTEATLCRLLLPLQRNLTLAFQTHYEVCVSFEKGK